MKKGILCAFLLCSIMLSGCQSQSASRSENPDINESAATGESGNASDNFSDIHNHAFSWNEEASDEQPAFAPYTLKVQRDELSVYDMPGYNTGNWLYDITDLRTITIIAEKGVRENGNIRILGQL